jgi:hypothetical protein
MHNSRPRTSLEIVSGWLKLPVGSLGQGHQVSCDATEPFLLLGFVPNVFGFLRRTLTKKLFIVKVEMRGVSRDGRPFFFSSSNLTFRQRKFYVLISVSREFQNTYHKIIFIIDK